VKYLRWIIGFMLAAGGVLGILGSAPIVLRFVQQREGLRTFEAIVGVGLFVWSVAAGIALWRAAPRGYRWAKVLFALQILTFSVTRFAYEFSTFFSLRLMMGATTRHIGGNIGSSSNIYWSPQPLGWMFGINIVAVVALLSLLKAPLSSTMTRQPRGSKVGL